MPGELNEQQIRQTAIILGLPADLFAKTISLPKQFAYWLEYLMIILSWYFKEVLAFLKVME
ncbi:hypothetical protein [Legionella clemsonensis]|uniref:Uncharacterized protein n=1 Tax=Legionella clemsonensis TaxID=1867846 RepID=A0A222P5E5_9GAMM|nr:hypothetical protein [Legionella clemsonensis]ASQ47043.1 hypothetical protein clem_12540 [Legionella clemsonensis]